MTFGSWVKAERGLEGPRNFLKVTLFVRGWHRSAFLQVCVLSLLVFSTRPCPPRPPHSTSFVAQEACPLVTLVPFSVEKSRRTRCSVVLC